MPSGLLSIYLLSKSISVSDRIAYLNFVQGSLAASVASKLDNARAPLKLLRGAEATLQPKRNIRTGMQTAIGRLESEQVKGNDRKIAELRESLKKAEAEDEGLEKELELLKRKALRESEQIKWDALREVCMRFSELLVLTVLIQYGEKLVLLSQAATPIIKVLPTIPPSINNPYTGRDTTGAVRASLQRALDNYQTGHVHLPPQPAPGDLSRSDTQSFGESHASELSSIYEEGPLAAAHFTPPKTEETNPPVINPQVLNQSPAQLPTTPASAGIPVVAAVSKAESSPSILPPAVTPTVAETGIPVIAGPGGTEPASGSLHDIRAGSPTPAAPVPVATPAAPKHETAEEEKRRLASLYSPPVQSTPSTSSPAPAPATISTPVTSSTGGQPQRYESAEDEKKRLEREEREKILRRNAPPDVPAKDEEELPPYQEPGL